MSGKEINGAGLPKNAAPISGNINPVDREKLEKETTKNEIREYFKSRPQNNEVNKSAAKAQEKLQNGTLTSKEQAKAELRKLESEYNKNYEKMTSEEVIELEIKMDAIKKDLATGKYDEEGGMILRPQMMSFLNTQKEEIEKELKDKTLSDNKRVALETRLEIVNNEIAEIQDEIKKDMDEKFFGE